MFNRYFLLLATLIISGETVAGPGDTTWVTVFSNMKLDHHGNYDTTVFFPKNKRYRKIRMHYDLGRYVCPGNPQYCGSWDYTTQIFTLPAGKNPVEIGRVITPYATDWLQKNKRHNYILDVTDYSSLLQDSSAIRFRYDGYSWGFTITLKFELIEGTPPMDAVAVENVYTGYFKYGDVADPIENHLVPAVLSYTTPRAAIRNVITGHGADSQGCSEFCSKYYNMVVNNLTIEQKQLWRNDCGFNEVYPQTGTWVFDRANWCPGAIVWPIHHYLDGHTVPSASFTADINMEPYTNGNPSGGYIFSSQLISYSDMNSFTDAAIEDIIAPSNDPNHGRQNPACANPVITLKNTGAGDLQSVKFEYGLTGRMLSSFTWTGSLKSMVSADITFPANLPVMAHSVSAQFEARIVEVNGIQGDGNPENDVYCSMTKPVIISPDDIIIQLGTNKSTSGGFSETSWRLYDDAGNIVAQRINATPNKIHLDTIMDLAPGCYRFEVADAGCDGVDWWYYQYYQTNPGKGNIRIDKIGQNNPVFLFSGDFGCGFSRNFLVGNYPPPPAIPNTTGFETFFTTNHVNLYPNPAEGNTILEIHLEQKNSVRYDVTDVSGRRVFVSAPFEAGLHYETIQTSGFTPGIYFVKVQVGKDHVTTRKLIVR